MLPIDVYKSAIDDQWVQRSTAQSAVHLSSLTRPVARMAARFTFLSYRSSWRK